MGQDLQRLEGCAAQLEAEGSQLEAGGSQLEVEGSYDAVVECARAFVADGRATLVSLSGLLVAVLRSFGELLRYLSGMPEDTQVRLIFLCLFLLV